MLARRFGQIAAELTGAAVVRHFHDQALFKGQRPDGGAPTGYHQVPPVPQLQPHCLSPLLSLGRGSASAAA